MASIDNAAASAEARARGNDLYKKGDLTAAEKAYKQAAKLAPNDPLPLSNLSAVHYERGKYSDAIDYIRRALALSSVKDFDSSRAQNMYSRLAKCHLHSFDYDAATETAQKLSNAELRDFLLSAASDMKMSRELQDGEAKRRLVMDRLPRYKPYLTGTPEYFPTGHDNAQSLFDKKLKDALTPRDDVSFLFCGSGDMRNIFATIHDTAFTELVTKKKLCKNIHFTMVDHKPAVLARNLLVMDMMHRYVVLKTNKVPNHEDALTVMSYIYTCQIVPAFVLEKVQEHIEPLIKQLEMGLYLVPCISVATQSIPGIIRVLKQWQQGFGEQYSVSAARSEVINQRKLKMMNMVASVGSGFDRKCFKQLGVLFPSSKFIKRREPALLDLVARFKEHGRPEELSDYLDANWKLNPTLFDLDYDLERTWAGVTERYVQLEFLPMEIVDALENIIATLSDRGGRLVDQFGQKFDILSIAMIQLHTRLLIECIVGDMSDVMERMRYSTLEHRSEPPADPEAHDPRKFPKEYDRIHMSNIPDYIGGHLTTFSYARPLLREDRASSFQFNNLLNPPMFQDHEAFQSEYLHLYNDDRIAQHFAVKRDKEKSKEYERAAGEMMPFHMGVKLTPFMREDYMIWERCARVPLVYKDLLPRPAFEKWLYSLLLKICLPFPRPLTSDRPVHAPLNLTQLFKLILQLSEIGYPAHWLSAVLASACSGVITTTARPPWELAMTPESLDKAFPSTEIGIEPWRAELTTLLSIWSELLSFGPITTAGTLVPLSALSEYRITFPDFDTPNNNVPHFMLLFWRVEEGGATTPPKNLRQFLTSEALTPADEKARRDGVHCMTTFRYKAYERAATFWLRDDVADTMKGGKWLAYIRRTDTWGTATEGVEVSGGLVKLRSWLGDV